jgi:hypothetical protein
MYCVHQNGLKPACYTYLYTGSTRWGPEIWAHRWDDWFRPPKENKMTRHDRALLHTYRDYARLGPYVPRWLVWSTVISVVAVSMGIHFNLLWNFVPIKYVVLYPLTKFCTPLWRFIPSFEVLYPVLKFCIHSRSFVPPYEVLYPVLKFCNHVCMSVVQFAPRHAELQWNGPGMKLCTQE